MILLFKKLMLKQQTIYKINFNTNNNLNYKPFVKTNSK